MLFGGARKMIHRSALALLVLSVFAVATPAASEGGRADKTDFNIPSQSVRHALIEFSKQADVQVMGSPISYGNALSTAVRGRLTTQKALQLLLRDTGLRFQLFRRAVVVNSLINPRTSMLAKDPVPLEPPALDGAGLDDDDKSHGDSHHIKNSLGTMTVTGTHIRDAVPVGSDLMVLDDDYLSRTGFSTIQDVIRSLPQNFPGGVSEDTIRDGTNVARSSTLNLRGLGSSATLVLLDGHRIAPSGISAAFVDVASLPLAAVERIEILTDGASAIYGADAIGGVVNIILKRDYDGAETQTRLGSVTQGAMIERQASQLIGRQWRDGHFTAFYDFHDRDALRAKDRTQSADSDLRSLGGTNHSSLQASPPNLLIGGKLYAIRDGNVADDSTVNYQNLNKGRDVIGEYATHSGFFSASQSVGPVSLSFETLLSQRDGLVHNSGVPASFVIPLQNPYRLVPAGVTTTAPITVLYNFVDSLGTRATRQDVTSRTSAAEMAFDVSNWRSKITFASSREDIEQEGTGNVNQTELAKALADVDPLTAFNAFGSNNPATLDRIRASTFYGSISQVDGVNWLIDGSLFGGNLSVAAGADYRRQEFRTSTQAPGAINVTQGPHNRRDVAATFAEVQFSLSRNLKISAAGRNDDYDRFGSTFSPRLGVEWAPIQKIKLKASWGKSFRAPNLPDLDESLNQSQIAILPNAQGGRSTVLAWFGGNADLQAEVATTWTMGLRMTPSIYSYVEVGYWDTTIYGGIKNPTFTDTILGNPRYANVVTRDPTAAQRAAICSRSNFVGGGDCLASPVDAVVDYRFNNSSRTATSGIDIAGQWGAQIFGGFFSVDTSVTWIRAFNEKMTRTSDSTSLVDRINNPQRYRSRHGVSWSRLGWRTSVSAYYAGSYVDNVSIPHRDIRSATTVDLDIDYEFSPATAGWLGGSSITLSAQNIFDARPPFANDSTGVGYDRENADLKNRFIGIRVKKKW